MTDFGRDVLEVIEPVSTRTVPLCQGSCPLLYFSLFFRWAG